MEGFERLFQADSLTAIGWPRLCTPTLHLQRRDDETMCWVGVHNLGQPIAAQHLDKLFDRFYRVDPSRAQPGDSGGLGLAIVQSIMHLHGGQVQARSDAQGTVFELGFPHSLHDS